MKGHGVVSTAKIVRLAIQLLVVLYFTKIKYIQNSPMPALYHFVNLLARTPSFRAPIVAPSRPPLPPRIFYQKNKKSGHSYKLTHLHFVMAWPPGYCKKHNCWNEVDHRRFYVHGIWPANADGNHMTYCGIPFPPENLAEPFETIGPTMMDELHKYWPSYGDNKMHTTRSEASLDLWRHEYLKHGSCAAKVGISLIDYFKLILKFRKLDFESSLAAAGILMGPSHSDYTSRDFSKTFEKDYGDLEVFVSCETGSQNLIEIGMCIDITTHELTKCPRYKKTFKCDEPLVVFHRILNTLV